MPLSKKKEKIPQWREKCCLHEKNLTVNPTNSKAKKKKEENELFFTFLMTSSKAHSEKEETAMRERAFGLAKRN